MQTQKIQLIECSGTSCEIGRQYGEAAKDNILKSLDFMLDSLRRGPFKIQSDEVMKASGRYIANAKSFDCEAIEWIRGIAQGAGISFEESFALKTCFEITAAYPGISGTGMCTSFALGQEVCRHDIAMLGQNIDWHPEVPVDILHIHRADGLDQFVICLSANCLYYMNSAGICNCANLVLSPMGPVISHVPLTIYLWKAMRCRTLGETMDVLKHSARGISYYHVGDCHGNFVGIESVYDDYALLAPDGGVLVHANHYETEKYRKNDLAPLYIPDSFRRAERMRQLVADSYGDITAEYMMDVLSDHHDDPDSICSHGNPAKPAEMVSVTRASFIMIPSELKIYVAYGPPCTSKYYEYSLK